jgi:hypothetical protein
LAISSTSSPKTSAPITSRTQDMSPSKNNVL